MRLCEGYEVTREREKWLTRLKKYELISLTDEEMRLKSLRLLQT